MLFEKIWILHSVKKTTTKKQTHKQKTTKSKKATTHISSNKSTALQVSQQRHSLFRRIRDCWYLWFWSLALHSHLHIPRVLNYTLASMALTLAHLTSKVVRLPALVPGLVWLQSQQLNSRLHIRIATQLVGTSSSWNFSSCRAGQQICIAAQLVGRPTYHCSTVFWYVSVLHAHNIHTILQHHKTTHQALTWNPQGKRKRGRPCNSWRRDTEAELKQQGTNWSGMTRAAQNRVRWQGVVDGLCSTGSDGHE